MLHLIHSPNSRSTRVIMLIEEMNIADNIEIIPVSILRSDGTGAPDPANPHPEAKVPTLLDGNTVITESAAIMLYLTQIFPNAGLAPRADDPDYGSYLSWLFWYQGVMEPVMMHKALGLAHPALDYNFRGMKEVADRLHAALQDRPYLCGNYSVADLLCVSAFTFMPHLTPEDALIRDWVQRCANRPSLAHAKEFDARLLAQAA